MVCYVSGSEVVTVQEIKAQRTAIRKGSIQESVSFLSKIGHYYEQTIPSKIERKFIFESERLLNDLYLKSLQEPATSKFTEQLLEALGQAGQLAIAVKNKSFGSDFVKTAKQLGRTLIRVSRLR